MLSASPRPLWPIAISALLGLVLLFVAQTTHPIVPSEDAYITYRYARNLAQGHGLVWNPGEDPVEGSTEFLWAVMLAAGHRLGLEVETAATVFNLAFGAAAVVLVAIAGFCLSGRRLLPSLFATAAFAVGPVAYHVRAGFATTLFTLLLTVCYVAAALLVLRQRQDRLRTAAFAAFALSGLFMGLTRPEGVFYAGLALLSLLVLLPGRDRRRVLAYSLALAILPGLVYFLWRWRYFGFLLPNTFYVKSTGGLLHLRYFSNIYMMFRFMAPLLLLIGLGLLWENSRIAYKRLVLLLPAFLFPWLYLLIDQLQNLGMRFQYPVYPVFLLAGAAALGLFTPAGSLRERGVRGAGLVTLLAGLALIIFGLFVILPRPAMIAALVLAIVLLKLAADRRWLGRRQAAAPIIYLVLAGALLVLSVQQSFRLAHTFYRTQFDDREVVGAALRPYADKGYTVVASEAGWIPYFSQWRAIDPFGLNDERVAHEGLSAEYLATLAPDIIMYHEVAYPDPPRWADMTRLLHDYAESHGYQLAAIVERKGSKDRHVYYVRGDNPDAAGLIDAITGHDQFIYQYRAP